MTVLERYLDRLVQPDMFAVGVPVYDEFAGPQGNVREAWTGLAEGLQSYAGADLRRAQWEVARLLEDDGVTYTPGPASAVTFADTRLTPPGRPEKPAQAVGQAKVMPVSSSLVVQSLAARSSSRARRLRLAEPGRAAGLAEPLRAGVRERVVGRRSEQRRLGAPPRGLEGQAAGTAERRTSPRDGAEAVGAGHQVGVRDAGVRGHRGERVPAARPGAAARRRRAGWRAWSCRTRAAAVALARVAVEDALAAVAVGDATRP